jgi:PIN domain nuclease of toxin-antitoxin system
MNLILDTHVLLWWLMADPRLSRKAKAAVEDPEVKRYVSSVTAFEIANKVRIGKLEPARTIVATFDNILSAGRFIQLDVTHRHGLIAGQLPGAHKDPFDRLLAAQARCEDLVLISADSAFDSFPVERLW